MKILKSKSFATIGCFATITLIQHKCQSQTLPPAPLPLFLPHAYPPLLWGEVWLAQFWCWIQCGLCSPDVQVLKRIELSVKDRAADCTRLM